VDEIAMFWYFFGEKKILGPKIPNFPAKVFNRGFPNRSWFLSLEIEEPHTLERV